MSMDDMASRGCGAVPTVGGYSGPTVTRLLRTVQQKSVSGTANDKGEN